MDYQLLRVLYPFALTAWLLGFGFFTLDSARWANRLSKATDKLDSRGHDLSDAAREGVGLIDQGRHAQGDLAFLQELPNLLPQDKGYIRTQKAISEEVQGLRHKLASKLKNQLHILVDAKANKLYLKKGFKLLLEADVSVGRGGTLRDKKTGRTWEFVTPRGEFRVIGKAENPEWRKPDWAYAETGEVPPPPEDPSRLVKDELGAFVLNLGDGYLIHGTKKEELLGRPASHGCVRVGAEDLAKLYAQVPTGTRVFIFY